MASQLNMIAEVGSLRSDPTRRSNKWTGLSRLGRAFAAQVTVAILATIVGCQSSSTSPPVPTDPSMLRGVVSTYRIAIRDLGRPPQNADELKTILAPVAKDPSEYLRSKRDGEDFVIIWGINLDAVPMDTIVAFEKTGVDGKRMVVSANGGIQEVTAEEFSKLKFPKDYKPAG